MLIGIGGVYLDPNEVVAVFPPDPEAVGAAVVLLRNGHLLELDADVSHVMRRLRDVDRADRWAAEVAGA